MDKSSIKVMVVDDEQVILDLFTQILNSIGILPICARNGEEALKIFKKDPPHLIFSDINMPKMNGLILLKEVKKIDPSSYIVLFTGYEKYHKMIAGLEEKPDAYLKKPFQVNDIVNIVKNRFPRLNFD